MFLLGSAAALLFSWGIATFPGERHDGNALSRSFEAVVEQVSGRPLFFNEVDVITGRHGGWFTNALVLPDAPLVDAELVEKIAGRDGNTPAAWGQRSLTQPRGRSFVSANFARADLRRADFRGANLESALLTNANLQDASLGWAQLRNANLDDAQLEGASLLFAQLQGASLRRARLRSASLDLAQLQGASLDFAELPGASLFGAQLQAASLFWAKLPGAMLDAAQLRGASLGLAELQGASLESAQLHGALLDGTQLQGASLDFAGLQGASLGGAQFRGASLRRAFVWRASKPVDGAFEHVRADDLDWTHLDPDIYPARERELETRPYPVLLAESLRGMESEPARVILSERIAVLDPDSPDPEGTTGERFWQKIQQDYDLVGHADFLVELACADENAPYVAEGLLRRPGMIEHMDFQGKGVSLRILNRLDAGDCPGAVGISGEAMRRLQGERRRQLDLAREVSPRG